VKDPCKESKCISYPICLSKTYIRDCILFDEYIKQYIVTEILEHDDKPNRRRLNVDQLKKLWKHIETIFPDMNSLSYRLTMIKRTGMCKPLQNTDAQILYESNKNLIKYDMRVRYERPV